MAICGIHPVSFLPGGVHSPRSVADHRAVLRNALNTAVRWGLVGRNVAAIVDAPKVSDREIRPLGKEDAKALLQAFKGERLEALFEISIALGPSQSECLGLRWADVDFNAATLRVERTLQREDGKYEFMESKSRRSRRTLPLPSPIVDSLRRHRVRQLEERLRVGPAWVGDQWGDLVFANGLGEPLSGFHVTRRLKKLLADAGPPTMRYHDLRHGATSLMAALGVPARVVMEIMGHAQFSTTMEIYAHVAPDLEREELERVVTSIWATS